MLRNALGATMLVAMLGVSLTGCTADNSKKIDGGAFLPNYGNLKQEPGGAFVWSNQRAQLWQYDKFVVEPLLIRFRPDFEKPVEMSQVDRFEKAYRDAIVAAMTKGGGFKQVNAPGPNTLVIRGAVTDARVAPAQPGDNRAAMEVGMSDASGDTQLFAMVMPRFAVLPDGTVSKDPQQIFTRFATAMRNELDRARAQPMKK